MNMRTGDIIRNTRIRCGFTQIELAKAIGTSQAAITAWETGKKIPKIDSLVKMANLFHIPVSTFLSQDENSLEIDTSITETLQNNPKLRTLFDKSRFLSDSDLDAVLSVVNAISKERNDD